MELEKLVLAELKEMDLHGANIISLSITGNTTQIVFEIGGTVEIQFTATSASSFQVTSLTEIGVGQVYTDEESLSKVKDWARYVISVVAPIIEKYQEELAVSDPNFRYDQLSNLFEEAKKELEETKSELKTLKQQGGDVRPMQGAYPPVLVSKRKKALSIIGNILFYIVLITTVVGVALFGLQEPDAPPRSLPTGHSVMTVLTRSMEPEIPQGALVIARRVDPNVLQVDDVITYLRPNNTTVTHRIISIIENYQGTHQRGFRLKGDNSATPDHDTVLAVNVIGEIVFTSLILGRIVTFVQDYIILIGVFIVLGIAFGYVIKKFFFDQGNLTPEPAVDSAVAVADDGKVQSYREKMREEEVAEKARVKKYLHLILGIVLIAICGYSIYRVLSYHAMYRGIEAAGAELRENYTQQVLEEDDDQREFLRVDWAGLLARNEDVVAWVHVPGTDINYPILAGATNEEYLRLDIDRQHSVAGSIFLEENNSADFLDLQTIIYGHNMNNGTKFAVIDAFVTGGITAEDAPYVYLYLPDGTVMIYQIVGAHLTNIHSMIYHLPVTDLDLLYELILEDNVLDVAFDWGEHARSRSRVLTLSTCAEIGQNSPVRSVLFGVLVEEREL